MLVNAPAVDARDASDPAGRNTAAEHKNDGGICGERHAVRIWKESVIRRHSHERPRWIS